MLQSRNIMQKIKYLEGLRGVAALIVLFNHLILTCFITDFTNFYLFINNSILPQFIKIAIIDFCKLCQNGELAVWIFWLLSSYVISILFFKPSNNYDNVVISYFSKRYVRLFIPVFGSVILCYLLLKTNLTYNNQLASKMGEPYLNGWLTNNLNFFPDLYKALKSAFYDSFFDYSDATSYNRVLWTIKNEFLGSLFTFSIFGILRHNKKRFILYAVILIILFELNLIWLVAFFIGHILCDYDFSHKNFNFLIKINKIEKSIFRYKYITLSVFILILLYSEYILKITDIDTKIYFLILSFIVVYFVIRNPFLNTVLSGKIPMWLGKISFSMYLIHLPIIFSFTSYFLLFNTTMIYRILISISTMIICFILSLIYTTYVDKNGVKLANWIGEFFKKNNS